jgi:hypothetical protein
MPNIVNPFKPGAGHAPPYLAGRELEKEEFKKLLTQTVVLSNLILTGLRGVGKTVLLEELKPIAVKEKWFWVGTDLSESSSVDEDSIVCRLLADLSVVTSSVKIRESVKPKGFSVIPDHKDKELNYATLLAHYQAQPGLAADKLKNVLEFVWSCLSGLGAKGVIFAYDEAQTMADHTETKQFPLSLLLDVFQSIQRKGVPFMMVMAGLPTLFPKLVETRTYTERMFNVQMLGRLKEKDCKEAIMRPIKNTDSAFQFRPNTVRLIVETSGGYPYFLQFICKELFDVFLQQYTTGGGIAPVAMSGIIQKLDKNFFAGRWAKVTERQRQLLSLIASLPTCDDQFTGQEIVSESRKSKNPFSSSHVNQLLSTLSDAGLVYKDRHGRYAFAVPLMGEFIRRQEKERFDVTQLNLPIEDLK